MKLSLHMQQLKCVARTMRLCINNNEWFSQFVNFGVPAMLLKCRKCLNHKNALYRISRCGGRHCSDGQHSSMTLSRLRDYLIIKFWFLFINRCLHPLLCYQYADTNVSIHRFRLNPSATSVSGVFLEWGISFGKLYPSKWNGGICWGYEWACRK